MLQYVFIILASYLIGSVPVSYLSARFFKGIDIRKLGSGNVGTTNVWRNAGPVAAAVALAGDLGKGVLAVLLAKYFVGEPLVVILAAVAVLIGHSWPIFLGFQGGKLVATGVGVLAAVSPSVGAITAAIWIVAVLSTRYVSVGSLLAVLAIPFLMLAFHLEVPYLILGIFIALAVIYKHIPNIKRLREGTEPTIR